MTPLSTDASGLPPSAVTVHCPMASARREPLWPLTPDTATARVGALGNCGCDADGPTARVGRALDTCDADAVVVVGHTACGAVAAAYESAVGGYPAAPAGLRDRLRALYGLAEEALDRGLVTAETPHQRALAVLAERNVVDQVTTLADHVGPGATVAGYVHDETGVYDSAPDRHYLVAVDDRTDPDAVAARVPDDRRPAVSKLL